MYNLGPLLVYQYWNLEKIQRRAARFILNDYSWHTSVSQLLLDVNLPSLQSRRSNSKAITVCYTKLSIT